MDIAQTFPEIGHSSNNVGGINSSGRMLTGQEVKRSHCISSVTTEAYPRGQCSQWPACLKGCGISFHL